MPRCATCEIISEILGKRFFERYFFENNTLKADDIYPLLDGLDLQLVGLKDRGWTVHDIDVTGSTKDVLVFVKRLKKHHITNPVHFCGERGHHSHIKCLWNGVKLLLGGEGY